MITPEFCVTFARYNAWQNKQLKKAFAGMDRAALTADRGAFFGSILATANHILWGDQMWLHRFGQGDPPAVPAEQNTTLCATREDWEIGRFRTDSRLLMWAEALHAVDLTGPLHWQSGITGGVVSKPLTLCIMGMFNHQTHHRGQIHAMLTDAGIEAPVTDLPFMPDTGPWL